GESGMLTTIRAYGKNIARAIPNVKSRDAQVGAWGNGSVTVEIGKTAYPQPLNQCTNAESTP
ncbi:MAG: hypothetical protein VX438_08225, partial [Planctomycetota bacterium]|nr:hypothetical protein [Planctomycetota bacterium]